MSVAEVSAFSASEDETVLLESYLPTPDRAITTRVVGVYAAQQFSAWRFYCREYGAGREANAVAESFKHQTRMRSVVIGTKTL